MSTINGLPAHVLFVHFVVVLVPVTAVLLIVSAVWPSVRRRLVWLVLVLAAVVVALVPLTTEAGEWLTGRVGPSPALDTHIERGDTMIYFAIPLLVAAVLLALYHRAEQRGRSVQRIVAAVVAVVAIAAGVAATVQVYRVGEAGSRAAWGDALDH